MAVISKGITLAYKTSGEVYTDLTDLVEFMKFKEEINYTLLDMANQEGLALAYPSQSIYLKRE